MQMTGKFHNPQELTGKEVGAILQQEFGGKLGFATLRQDFAQSPIARMQQDFSAISGGTFTPINYNKVEVATALAVTGAVAKGVVTTQKVKPQTNGL